MLRWVTVALFAFSAYLVFDRFVLERPIMHGSGVTTPDPPLQEALEREEAPRFQRDGFDIRALASFELDARVLGVETYCCWGADSLVPVDVAFGWGRMSDEAVLARIDITQGRRFYFWHYEGSPPIPRREIETSSANMHLIAATRDVEKAMKKLRRGHLVTLRGYLVEARRQEDGALWRSSLARTDTGNNACELIWVEELEARKRAAR